VARAALAGWLGGWPLADDAILVASEFATNAVLHSDSSQGGAFALRVEVGQDRLRIEVEDAGGPWRGGVRDDGRPHGFDVVAAIAGAGNWGIDGGAGGRVAWAELGG
jgi:anti-sigma regulatory factor (Ser/Thr protein kinase)